MKKTQDGFTLIELMIVVAIIAILAAIAIPAYNQYLRETRMNKVITHYDEAYRAVKAEVSKYVAIQSRAGNLPAELGTGTYWINKVINPDGQTAPGGGDAFLTSGPNDTTGAVGVLVSGSTLIDLTVKIARPDYLDLTDNHSVSVSAVEL